MSGDAYYATSAENLAYRFGERFSGEADEAVLPNLGELRNLSGDLDRNAPLAVAILNTIVDNVVGSGLTVKPKIDDDFLGLSKAEKAEWERTAGKLFNYYANSRYFDAQRRNNFYQMTRVAFRTVLSRGDGFFLRRFEEGNTNPLGLAFQYLEGDRLATPEAKKDRPNVKAGIQFDPAGHPVKYWFKQPQKKGDTEAKYTGLAAFDEMGFPVVIPMIPVKRGDQTRAEPLLAPSLHLFKQLNEYLNSEVDAAVTSSKFTVFVTKDGNSSPLDAAKVRAKAVAGKGSDSPASPAPRKQVVELKSGAIIDLAPGEKIEAPAPTRPNSTCESFVMMLSKLISASCGVPVSVVLKGFTSSYSASRGETLQAEKFFKIARSWLISAACQPIYELVISTLVAQGKLKAPGFFDDFFVRQAWLGARWRGPATGMIDPYKEGKAAELFINILKMRDRETTCAELFGEDWKHTFNQIADEEELMGSALGGEADLMEDLGDE